jgi:hypothetical protein
MSRFSESFEYLDRGWDIRVLEGLSLRSVFLWLILLLFLVGMDAGIELYKFFHFHRIDPPWLLPIWAILAFRYSRLVYLRLGR